MQQRKYTLPTRSAREIATRLGLHRAGRGWRGRCPSCGYQDALSLDLGADGCPLLWCAACGNREAMVRLLRDLDALPPRSAPPPTPRRDDRARIERARDFWAEARLLDGADPASKYLTNRRIAAAIGSPALRWSPGVPHPSGDRRLALLARIDDVHGELVGVQRVFLTPAGEKAAVEPVKASLGTVAGGAVRLAEAVGEVVVAEGVESAAAAGVLLSVPAWAAVSAGNLARTMALPPSIRGGLSPLIATPRANVPRARPLDDGAPRGERCGS